MALGIPVRARPDASGRTTVRLRATVRLPNGQNLRPTPSTRQHPDRTAVEHVVLFPPASTRRLVRAARAPKLTIRAFAARDADGDGAAETTSRPATVVTTVPRLRRRPPPPRPAPPGPVEGPCGVVAFPPPDCVVVTGAPWAAPHRWATFAWRLECPAGTAPVEAVAVAASSRHYAISRVVTGAALWVEITDDAAAGHPATYTPTAGCLPLSPAAGG